MTHTAEHGDLSAKHNILMIHIGKQIRQKMEERQKTVVWLSKHLSCSRANVYKIFEKYSVRIGGGNNHRYNLSDGVLLKDNHIGAAGGVKQAISMAKAYAPFVRKIEVEVENLDMVKEAVEAGADIIMLDNMSTEQLKESIDYIAGRAEIEVSGNVTKENIARLTGLGVNYVSSGALTHSAPILDLSMKNLHPVE